MKGMKEEEEVLETEETIEEEETSTEDVVAEEETAEEVVAEYDVEEDVNALLGGEELSEEFKEKAKTIFEAAINAKVAEIKETLESQYAEKLLRKSKQQKSHSLSVLILILSTSLTSGLKKTHSPSRTVLRLK